MNQQVFHLCSAELPVDETLSVLYCRFQPDSPDRPNQIKRICLVTGTHGDELEGQYVCFEVARRLREYPEYLNGIVDIYPALNPLGIDTITRGIPAFDLDLNRIFPGDINGTMVETMANEIVASLQGANLVIDYHASNIFLKEIPQARISDDSASTVMPFAEKLNLDFLWIHSSATVLESTLAHSLNSQGTPCVVVEVGVGMRITRSLGDKMVVGAFTVMKDMGIWTGPVDEISHPIDSRDGTVYYLNAACSGIFVPDAKHEDIVKKDEQIGIIMDPLRGKVLQRILAPCDGYLFTLRAYPVVYEGSLLGRIFSDSISEEENQEEEA